MKRSVLIGTLAVSAAVALTACGSSNSSTAGGETSSMSVSETPTMSMSDMPTMSMSDMPTTATPTPIPRPTASTARRSPSPSPSATRSTTAPAAKVVMLRIKDFKFSGASRVAPGTKVMVMNSDSEAHTVTSNDGRSFDVKVKPGGSAVFTAPAKPGSYAYHCTYHASMHGNLTVS